MTWWSVTRWGCWGSRCRRGRWRWVRVGGASLQFVQSIRRCADGVVLVTAEVKAASLSASAFRPVALSDALKQVFLSASQGAAD